MIDPYTLQGLLHEPYGEEHPYEQLPTERFPRDPIAGDAVTLGVATWPRRAAEAVWATWVVAGCDGEAQASAASLDGEGERSYWRVRLPAFGPGQQVAYRLHARQGARELTSGAYTFVAAAWQPVGDVRDWRLVEGGVEVACIGGERLTARLHTRGALWLRWEFPHHPPTPFLSHCGGEEGGFALPSSGRERSREAAHDGSSQAGRDSPLSPCRRGGASGRGDGGEGPSPAWTTEEAGAERLVLAAGGWRLLVHRRPCRLELQRADGTVLLAEAEPAQWLFGEGGRPLRLRETFVSVADEAFYGFGERFDALDQRGSTPDVCVYAQFTAQGHRTYIPAPFFISSRGYGLHLDTARHVAYDLAASRADRWHCDAELGPDGSLDAYLFTGEPGQMVAGYTGLTGKPALPPVWAFGPWMSGNEWNSQPIVMEQVRKASEHDVPATVLVIEAWSDESTFYIWNDAQYLPSTDSRPFSYGDFTFPPEGRWPDPKGMIDEMHRRGIRLLLWQVPVLKRLEGPHAQHDADVAHAIARGYCVREADGQPYRIRPEWFRGGLALDVTNPEAVDWWLAKRAYLLDELGIDGFKTDGGEHLWGRDLRFADGRRGDELLNLYPNLYVGAYHRFAREKRGGDAITFSRAGFAGAQAYPCHWAGDERSTWEAFRASILAGLSAGISGMPFWGWDLAGFTGEIPSAELYLRAVAMAAFCPIMQYHMDYNGHRQPSRDRTPWNIQERTGDPDVIPIFRRYAKTRMNLLPYIYSEANRCCETGLPLMRALPLAFPGDPACRDYPYQYLFGESLLVAPVVSEGCAEQAVYLPQGDWYDLWTGEAQRGGRTLACPTPKGHIPVFVRAGAILPLNLGDSCELDSPVGNAVDRFRHLCFQVYPQGESCYLWHDHVTGAARALQCTADAAAGTVAVHLGELDQPSYLIVRSATPAAVSVDGRELERSRSLAAWYRSPAGAWCARPADACTLVGLAAGPARTVDLQGCRTR